MADDSGFARTYGVGLLLPEPARLDPDRLHAALIRGCGRVDRLIADKPSVVLFSFPDHTVEHADDEVVPTQLMLLPSEDPLPSDVLESSLEQTWDFPGARDAVNSHRATVYVTDFLANGLPYAERLELFHNALSAVLDELPQCLAIHWVQAQRVVDPQNYRQLRAERGADDPVYPAISVRIFGGDSSSGEVVMDTVGLAALGVPDVQCHFVGLEVNAVANALYGAAYYLFERGDVIEDGETIQGVGEGVVRWRCQHEEALIPPARVVLDLDPGPPFSAGERGGDEESAG